jgi:hypothetical protein
MIYCDETQLTAFGNNNLSPIYIWIANLPTAVRASHGKGGAILVGYMPDVWDSTLLLITLTVFRFLTFLACESWPTCAMPSTMTVCDMSSPQLSDLHKSMIHLHWDSGASFHSQLLLASTLQIILKCTSLQPQSNHLIKLLDVNSSVILDLRVRLHAPYAMHQQILSSTMTTHGLYATSRCPLMLLKTQFMTTLKIQCQKIWACVRQRYASQMPLYDADILWVDCI